MDPTEWIIIFHLRTEADPTIKTFCSLLEYWTRDNVQKFGNIKCNTLSSEPFETESKSPLPLLDTGVEYGRKNLNAHLKLCKSVLLTVYNFCRLTEYMFCITWVYSFVNLAKGDNKEMWMTFVSFFN
jgi:hypothetical protein